MKKYFNPELHLVIHEDSIKVRDIEKQKFITEEDIL